MCTHSLIVNPYVRTMTLYPTNDKRRLPVVGTCVFHGEDGLAEKHFPGFIAERYIHEPEVIGILWLLDGLFLPQPANSRPASLREK